MDTQETLARLREIAEDQLREDDEAKAAVPYPPSMQERRVLITLTRLIRGHCYRFKAGRTDPQTESGQLTKKLVEGLPGFRGWKLFAETWDLDRNRMIKEPGFIENLEISELVLSLVEQHNVRVRRAALELPTYDERLLTLS